MNNFATDYASILSEQARMKEIVQKAEQEHQAKNPRENVVSRVRRVLRINNDPIR